jgi:hypothetical protein
MHAANIAQVVRDTNGAELTFVECAPRLERTAQGGHIRRKSAGHVLIDAQDLPRGGAGRTDLVQKIAR